MGVPLGRLLVAWGGPETTGGGVSVFHFGSTDMTGNPGAVLSFFNTIKNFWPSTQQWTVPNEGVVIDDSDGSLLGAWTASGGGTVSGGASGSNWAQAVGLRVTWPTGAIINGHHVTGSTFLTSMNAQEYQVDGTVQNGTVTAIQNAGTTLVASAVNFRIWSRPRPADPTHVPPLPFRAGGSANVTSCHVPDKISWLKSRRT